MLRRFSPFSWIKICSFSPVELHQISNEFLFSRKGHNNNNNNNSNYLLRKIHLASPMQFAFSDAIFLSTTTNINAAVSSSAFLAQQLRWRSTQISAFNNNNPFFETFQEILRDALAHELQQNKNEPTADSQQNNTVDTETIFNHWVTAAKELVGKPKSEKRPKGKKWTGAGVDANCPFPLGAVAHQMYRVHQSTAVIESMLCRLSKNLRGDRVQLRAYNVAYLIASTAVEKMSKAVPHQTIQEMAATSSHVIGIQNVLCSNEDRKALKERHVEVSSFDLEKIRSVLGGYTGIWRPS
jgi:hypothetical protein